MTPLKSAIEWLLGSWFSYIGRIVNDLQVLRRMAALIPTRRTKGEVLETCSF